MVNYIADPKVKEKISNLIPDKKKTPIRLVNNIITHKINIHKYSNIFVSLFEIVISCMALIILSPIIAIVSLLIILEDGFPIIFTQTRLGKNGKRFKIYKFRSMKKNAEEILKKDLVLYSKYISNDFKIPAEEDPRITRIGKYLRKWSLDEIPQFINVIKGDMALVGPRPIVPPELDRYDEYKDKFLSVKPGITGLWQVTGRSEIEYPDRKYLDLIYIENKSFWLDLKILILTIIQVMKAEGSY
jgi:lipopolysaccharide/colanic/teichoic acid biosynthesis glycosyltransferase